jgi:hypothetical protein
MVYFGLGEQMLRGRLPYVLAFAVLVVLFFSIVSPPPYTIAQNATTDGSTVAEETDGSTAAEETVSPNVNSLSEGSGQWRKARLDVQVEVVGGSAQESDFVIQVTSSTTDQSVKLDQYPQTFQGDREVILRVSNIPSSPVNYDVAVVDQPNGDYSPAYEGCSGSWELGQRKTCKIINYFNPQPPPDFQIAAHPEELTVKPQSSNYSTLTLIPSQDNRRDAIIDVDLDTQWIGTAPDGNDVTVTFEQSSIRLVGTERQDIDISIQSSQDAPNGEAFTLSIMAEGQVEELDLPISDTADIQIKIPVLENTAPEAVASLNKYVANEGERIELDGSKSTDVDGDELTYSWEIISGLTNVQIPYEESRRDRLSFNTPTVDEDTTIMFQLTVSDGKPGGTDIARTELRIADLTSNNPTNDDGDRSSPTNDDGDRSSPTNDDGDRSSTPLDTIPADFRRLAGGFAPSVGEESSNNNNLLLLAVIGIIVVGGIALVKYKMSRAKNNRGLKISPSALVEIRTKGGMAR